jgi:hypothetical protein
MLHDGRWTAWHIISALYWTHQQLLLVQKDLLLNWQKLANILPRLRPFATVISLLRDLHLFSIVVFQAARQISSPLWVICTSVTKPLILMLRNQSYFTAGLCVFVVCLKI